MYERRLQGSLGSLANMACLTIFSWYISVHFQTLCVCVCVCVCVWCVCLIWLSCAGLWTWTDLHHRSWKICCACACPRSKGNTWLSRRYSFWFLYSKTSSLQNLANTQHWQWSCQVHSCNRNVITVQFIFQICRLVGDCNAQNDLWFSCLCHGNLKRNAKCIVV